MARPYLLFFIIISLNCLRNPFADIELDKDSLLIPFFRKPFDQMKDEYELDFKNHLNYKINTATTDQALLKELYSIDSGSLDTPVVTLHKEYILKVLKTHIIKERYSLDKQTNEFKNTISDLAKNIIIRSLQDKLDAIRAGMDVNFEFGLVLTPLDIKLTLTDLFEDSVQEIDREKVDLEKTIQFVETNFFQKEKELVAFAQKFLKFKTTLLKDSRDLTLKAVNHAIHDAVYTAKDYNEELDLMIKKLLSLTDFYAHFYPENRKLEIGRIIASELMSPQVRLSKAVHIIKPKFIASLLLMYADQTESHQIKEGKRLFVSYIYDIDSYPAPSETYQIFLSKRYRNQHLKMAIIEKQIEYRNVLKIQIINLIHTSLYTAENFISSEDLLSIYNLFPKFIKTDLKFELKYFLTLRDMFDQSGDLINKLPSLFGSLHDAIMHSAEEFITKDLFSDAKNRPAAVVFDEYLNYLWSWTNQNRLIKFLFLFSPNDEELSVNINQNYPFFKLVNLVNNMEALSNSDNVLFYEFEYFNDYLIHQYTVSRKANQFLAFVRKRLYKEEVINYRILKTKVLKSELLKDYLYYLNVNK